MVLFANIEKGIFINLDFTNGFKQRLAEWLKSEQEEVYDEIEFWHNGTVTIEMYKQAKIVFSGDNGRFELEQVEIKTV